MRLFRQSTIGDWAEVFEQIGKALGQSARGGAVTSGNGASRRGSPSGQDTSVTRAVRPTNRSTRINPPDSSSAKARRLASLLIPKA